MNGSAFPHPESSSVGESVPISQAAFSQLYDQYAPILFGIIAAIVGDESEAVRLLETTFVKIRLQFGHRPKSESQFIWLLSIARHTALEATKSQKKSDPSVRRFTSTGKLTAAIKNDTIASIAGRRTLAPTANELLDAVLFKDCTPEEAVSANGLPVSTARQQLRMAMQPFRTPKTV